MRGTLLPVILCLLLAVVGGCGQKGALFLPDEAVEETAGGSAEESPEESAEESPEENPAESEAQEENGESEES